jgi:hypothetical protein
MNHRSMTEWPGNDDLETTGIHVVAESELLS